MLEAPVLDGVVPVEPALIESQPTRAFSVAIHGEPQACSGPLLADVLAKRGVPSTGDLRGAAPAMAVAIAARDGYRVALHSASSCAARGRCRR